MSDLKTLWFVSLCFFFLCFTDFLFLWARKQTYQTLFMAVLKAGVNAKLGSRDVRGP